ncbi:MAG: glycosyltransferase family 2 protein [Vicinamibacterales bacterium]
MHSVDPVVAAPAAVSVVVSTRNRATALRAAVARLVRQETTVPYEVILVDNASRDSTRKVVEDAARDFPDLVRIAFEPVEGVSNGRNRGIALSRAAILAFTDDDVEVTPGWVEGIWRAMEAHPEAACIGGPVLPTWTVPPPAWLTRTHWSPLALVDYGDEPFYVSRERQLCLVTANAAYRRAVLDRVGWFSPEFPRGQDHELLFRVWRAGLKGLYVPSLVVQCEVPAERLRWRYHRKWHATRGRFIARLPDDALDRRGNCPRRTLFGSPVSIHRQLAVNAARAIAFRSRLKLSESRAAEAEVIQLGSFVASRARTWRREQRGIVSELRRFVAQSRATHTRV